MIAPDRTGCSSGAARLALGTVQFGMSYGITNPDGQVDADTVSRILRVAHDGGIDTLDTASLYGDSEDVVGRAGAQPFHIVTKTPKFMAAGHSAQQAASLLRQSFEASLDRLRVRAVKGLLIHDPADLMSPLAPAIWRELEALKAERLVEKVGVSVYTGEEIDILLDRFPLDLVQLPFNPLDRRLIEGGQIERLAEHEVEVHVRSLFLQGLLLQDAETIPAKFGSLRHAISEMHGTFTSLGVTRLEGILASVFRHPGIFRYIVGVTKVEELEQVQEAANRAAALDPISFRSSIDLDPRVLNPALWAELG